MIITRLSRSTKVQHHYSFVPPDKSERRTCRLEAKTPVHGGTLVVLPPTYYELNLLLTEGEYRRLRALPAASALEVQLRRVRRHFRDVILTYRGTLDDPRVFPEEYAERMTALARAMIAYFDDDVDVVGHYCGLEVYVFRESCHLPSIAIEARSVDGNRKACQAACEALSQEAANLFGVRFDHVSLAVEEMRDRPEPPSPAAPEASMSNEEQL